MADEQDSEDAEGSEAKNSRSRLAIVASIVALVISASTMLTKCSRQEEDRFSGFRAAVASEESSWRALYSNYLDAFGKDGGDAEGKRQRFVAVYTLAAQDLPNFEEFDVPAAEKRGAICRLQRMQTSLVNSLADQSALDPELKKIVDMRSFPINTPEVPPDPNDLRHLLLWILDSSRWNEVRRDQRVQATCAVPNANASAARQALQPVPSAPQTVPSPSPSPSPSSAASAVGGSVEYVTNGSSTGWDVTINWCSDKPGSHAIAATLGSLAGAKADSGLVIAPGIRLGQISLKQTTSSHLPIGGSPRSVSYGDRPGESETAGAISKLFEEEGGVSGFKPLHLSGQTSRWAVAAYVCGQPQP